MTADPAHPERDQELDRTERGETLTERLDRNWGDLLQEIRVVQTGVQLLTGFLLTLPFQQRFTRLDTVERDVFLATVSAALTATAFLLVPVLAHRATFRQRRRERTVLLAHRCSITGTAMLAVSIVGVAFTVFAVLEGRTAAVLAALMTAVLLVALWVAVPASMRRRPG